MMNRSKLLVLVGSLTCLLTPPVFSQNDAPSPDAAVPVTDRQVAVMMFVDYGRSYGYQSMMAQIQIDTVTAELDRDRQILVQTEALFKKNAIPRINLEIAQLKVLWGEKQLIVAEKNLTAIAAQYEAMQKMAAHFADTEVPIDELYAVFRRGWEPRQAN